MCAKYVKQLSETPCEGSYDCVDDHTVRVTRGCRASFALRSGKTFICESWDKRDVRELASGGERTRSRSTGRPAASPSLLPL